MDRGTTVKEHDAAEAGLPPELSRAIADEVERQTARIRAELEASIAELRERTPEDRAAIVVFSGDLDHAIAAFILGTGAAAAGLETSMFFTFWGLSLLKKKGVAPSGPRSFKERMFAMMSPSSSESVGTSQMNYFGAGANMLRAMMKEKEVSSLEELMEMARDLGVRIIGCTMSMDVMGIEREQLADDIEIGGVAAFMADAMRSRVSLFI